MPDGALGGLFKGATASFNQGREYNLAVADARASAALRLRTMQMEDERRALEEERLNIYRDRVKFEQDQALKAEKEAKKLTDEARGYAETIAEELYPSTPPSGRDVTAEVKAGRKTEKIEDIIPRRAAGRAAVMLAPGEAAKKLAGRETGKGSKAQSTGPERLMYLYTNASTPDNVRNAAGRMLFGGIIDKPWNEQSAQDKIEITKVFSNVKFTESQKYRDVTVDQWFNTEILGDTSSGVNAEYNEKLRKAQEKKKNDPNWDYDGYVKGLNAAYGK
jgi:hypothetical protein